MFSPSELTLYKVILTMNQRELMSKLILLKKTWGNWSGREDLKLRPQRPERCALNQTALLPDFVRYCKAQRAEHYALCQNNLFPDIR
jgi:hypothetical protein